ncbi:MAG: hypothetical protein KKD44_18700 [Proteobacteria bacterium]|nr:hypothetical protein [Pseudomonadota bacterium]
MTKVVPWVRALPVPDDPVLRMASDAAMGLINHFKEIVKGLREDTKYYRDELRKCEEREFCR